MHEVLVNRLGGLSLPRKSVVRLTDRPDMTLDVYRGRKTTNQQSTTSSLSSSQHIRSLFSLLPHPRLLPPPPANADLGLHTKIYPTVLGHEFISILRIVFVSLVYFSFSYLPIRRLDRQEEAFSDALPPPPASCLGNMWIGERGIFSDVMFHSEAQYENHDSKVTVNHFITRPLMSSDYFWAA